MVNKAKNSTHCNGAQGSMSNAFCVHQRTVILFSLAG